MIGGLSGEGLVIKIVVHIGQHSRLRRHLFDPAQGVLQMAVGGVRVPAQRIDNPAVQVFKVSPLIIWNINDIRKLRDDDHAKPKRNHTTIPHQHRREAQRAPCAINRHLTLNFMQIQDRRIH